MDDRTNYIKKLEEISHITADEAKKLLVEEVKNDLKAEIAKEIKEAEAETKASAHKKAQEILADAIKHGALDFLPEYTLSVVKIDDEDMKGRIIGKEGRNIRSFENATGVDVDLEERGIIRISSFDPVRREVV